MSIGSQDLIYPLSIGSQTLARPHLSIEHWILNTCKTSSIHEHWILNSCKTSSIHWALDLKTSSIHWALDLKTSSIHEHWISNTCKTSSIHEHWILNSCKTSSIHWALDLKLLQDTIYLLSIGSQTLARHNLSIEHWISNTCKTSSIHWALDLKLLRDFIYPLSIGSQTLARHNLSIEHWISNSYKTSSIHWALDLKTSSIHWALDLKHLQDPIFPLSIGSQTLARHNLSIEHWISNTCKTSSAINCGATSTRTEQFVFLISSYLKDMNHAVSSIDNNSWCWPRIT